MLWKWKGHFFFILMPLRVEKVKKILTMQHHSFLQYFNTILDFCFVLFFVCYFMRGIVNYSLLLKFANLSSGMNPAMVRSHASCSACIRLSGALVAFFHRSMLSALLWQCHGSISNWHIGREPRTLMPLGYQVVLKFFNLSERVKVGILASTEKKKS